MCESLSLCIHNNAKLIELIVDVVLFFFTLLFLIICSIDVDRGAEFKYDNNEIYFTIGKCSLLSLYFITIMTYTMILILT